MRCILLIITCLVIAGSVSDSVKSGESVTLRVKTPGLGNMTKVTLQKNCQNRTGDPIILYCSPDEKKRGCSVNESKRFSIKFDRGSFSVTFADARVSDEGSVESLETPEDFPIKGKDTLWKISDVILLAVGIALLTAVVILAFIFVINYIINCQKQKASNITGKLGNASVFVLIL
ncbi:putative cytosol aminopeptidase [Labeo rohita]|uniref:Cytosol aminopeptidase n=1 Tax=Labeo rohita TaxID=84645 RepID=A0ABQ8KZ42_LABRO|nr:putative cytosol aminopeptidase [Labeo rohita]